MGTELEKRMNGVLMGTAAGDSLGLPAEGISRDRLARLFKGPWCHRFLPGCGMLSDDTEHAIFVTQSLLEAPDSAHRFSRRLASRLKFWVMLLPAGVGFATLRSALKLMIGFSPQRSGVNSAGNGPAMRSAPLGAFFYDEPMMLREFVSSSTRMTHTDARAYTGALAVGLVTAWSVREELTARPSPGAFMGILFSAGDDEEWTGIIEKMREAIDNDHTVSGFADTIGASRGISGYIYVTVPVALYAWYRHFGDFRAIVESVLSCGGDTDTAGAIAGAMAGSVTGEEGIPEEWVRGIIDWPRTTGYIRRLSSNLARVREGSPEGLTADYFWPGLVFRNIFFLLVVLLHGLRRLLPPY